METATRWQIADHFPEQHLPLFFGWYQEFSKEMIDDYTPKTWEQITGEESKRLQFWRDGYGGKSYAVMGSDGVPLGVVWGEHLGDGCYDAHLVFARDGLSSAEKVCATQEALRQWFADGARKIYWKFVGDNIVFQRFLGKVGARQEGRFEDATRRDGQLLDNVVMATFRKDI